MPCDTDLMQRCLDLASQGRGAVHPNPMVGAVLSRKGEILAEGWHRGPGKAHAEADCLRETPDGGARGLTLHVNLEPCSHHGRTPPCCELLVRKGVSRVVCGMVDPNPRVAGSGICHLREHGIEVEVGVLEAECRELNRTFVTRQLQGRPRVELKWAQSLDGMLTDAPGRPLALTGKASRRFVHGLRAQLPAILAGSGTALADDPLLTVRDADGTQPLRIVLDGGARLAPDSRLARSCDTAPLWIAVAENAEPARCRALEAAGARVLRLPQGSGGLSLEALLVEVDRAGLDGLLVEGGAQVLRSFLEAGLADRLHVGIAPLWLGKGLPALERRELHKDFGVLRQEQIENDQWITLESRASREALRARGEEDDVHGNR